MIRRLACLSLLLLIAGCGYTAGYKKMYAPTASSVAVPVFKTTSFYRGTEISLTKAVINQLEAKTPYKVVPAARADTILEGQIVSINVGNVSNSSYTATPQEQAFSITMDLTWKDLRTGRVIVERRNFEQTSVFYPQLGEGRFVGEQQAIEGIAAGIVNELQGDW